MRNYPRLHERRRKGNSEMELEIPDEVVIVELEGAPFRNAREARAWSVSHGVVGVMSDIDTHGKGEIAISVNSIRKMASGSAALKMYRESGRHNKAYSYEICNIEILKGNAAPVARPNDRISMPTRILLNGVRDVNGVPLIAGGREGCEGGCDAR